MDLVLDFADKHVLTPYVYPTSIPEDNMLRQLISLFAIATTGGTLLYFIVAGLSYIFLFDKTVRKHPHFYKNQEKLEIIATLKALPLMSFLTAVCFLFEVRGYSKLYDNVNEHGGPWFLAMTFLTFLLFTDFGIYWIHRWLHWGVVYKHLHKMHHKWKVTTPFSSHAFHPLDGFAQSIPYHLYVFIFPMHKLLYLGLFVFVNCWSVLIHDANYQVPNILKPFVNGCAHHMDHHLKFTVNYGQYFTLWDRIGGSFRHPGAYSGDGPREQAERYMQRGEVTKCEDPQDSDSGVEDAGSPIISKKQQ